MTAPSVAAYIATAPPEQRSALKSLRKRLAEHLEGCTRETIGTSGFPVRVMDDAWIAGFAWRTKGTVLYVMNSSLLDEYAERLGKSRTGKSCIEWRATKAMSLQELGALADEILREAARRLAK